ncbi:MAG TPA: TetR family transcriptional regulator [Mycobacterium sp.]|nr:TetR family transcriptional regulator [Mycobacterium sp.]
MIADAIGVTKAAVYHQYKSKNQIVIAVTENELAILEDALVAAEADERRQQARRTLLIQLIDRAVTRRQWVGTLTSDPVIVRILVEHPPFQRFMSRLYGVLLDQRDDTQARVAAAIMSAATGIRGQPHRHRPRRRRVTRQSGRAHPATARAGRGGLDLQ